ncbi:hypothetical protein GCM10010406_02130 [Streptomyces thermolineatus]|uniref:HTH lysR-type domain-containing protein n=1 Tax=Streptomyces thermolineatus TaxID=44033 RepID=A0ABN3KVT9_9ACTN
MGVPLFYRLPHGVRLTAAGETFQSYVGKIFNVMDEMSTALKNNGEATGRVVVGATALLMEYEMEGLVRECRYRYPHVQVSLKVMTSKDVEKAVASGGVDIGLTLACGQGEAPAGVLRQALFPVPFVPVGAPGMQSGPAPRTVERVLVVDPDCASQEVLLRHLASVQESVPSLMETGSTRSALGLAGAGLGVAMVPEVAVDGVAGPAGPVVLEDLPRASVHVQALWSGDGWLSPAVSAFLDLARRARGSHVRPPHGERGAAGTAGAADAADAADAGADEGGQGVSGAAAPVMV